jgi:hypothetical protein
MAPSVVAVSTTASWPAGVALPTGCVFTPNWPTVGASGRLILLPIFARSSSPPAVNAVTIDLTSGYTLKSTADFSVTNVTGEIQAKIAAGSDAAPSVRSTIEDTQPTGAIGIVIDGWSGNLADVTVTIAGGASATPQAPAGVAAVSDSLVLRAVFGSDDNLTSTPANHTQVFAETTLQGSDAVMTWYSQNAPQAAGVVAALNIPFTAGSDSWLAVTIVIAPTAGGTTYQLSAVESAHGTLSANAKVIAKLAEAFSAHGTFSIPNPKVIAPLQRNLAAAGVMAANPNVVAAQSASMTAAGRFMAQARVVHQLQLTMQATGTFNAVPLTPGGSGMFTPGPCSPWEPVWGNCVLPTGSEAISGDALMAASEVLWSLTGQRFGTCTVTLRPCRESCYGGSWLEDHGWWQFGSYPTPAWFQGAWFNIGCGSCTSGCSCGEISELKLPGPVASIESVVIGGETLDPTAYSVQNWNLLVRMDGGQWPLCNDFSSASGDGVWTITASFGEGVPVTGKLAVAELAVEYAKLLMCDDSCRLPSGVQQITRQGVSMTFNDIKDVFDSGLVGLPLSDRFIKTWNPNQLMSPSAVYDIDGGTQDWRRLD